MHQEDFDEEDHNSNLEMEIYFYKCLSGLELNKIEVIPIPDEDGEVISAEDLELVKKECKRRKLKLLYRISHRSGIATVFNPLTKITGVVPEYNPRGFYC